MEKNIVIAETKLNKSKIRLSTLTTSAQLLLQHYEGYHPTFLALGIEDALMLDKFLN